MTDVSKPFSALLERPPVLSSRDVDEVRTLLSGSHDRFDVGRSQPGEFFLRIHGVRAGDATIAYVRSGAPVRTHQAAALDAYTILLPLRRNAEMVIGGRRVVCDSKHGAIGSPDRDLWISAEEGCSRLWVSVGQAAITRRANVLLGEGLSEPVVFEPRLDLTARPSKSLWNAIAFVASELSCGDSAFYNPVLRKNLEGLLVETMLLSQHHNYSDRLSHAGPHISPRDVRTVVDFMHASLHCPIALEDLVTVSGVPGRTLRQHFCSFLGMSPMTYLREARYQRARQELLRADGSARVTVVATRCGFNHLGRFSMGYRRRFGESPSETAAGKWRDVDR